jgi:hypothetical protein
MQARFGQTRSFRREICYHRINERRSEMLTRFVQLLDLQGQRDDFGLKELRDLQLGQGIVRALTFGRDLLLDEPDFVLDLSNRDRAPRRDRARIRDGRSGGDVHGGEILVGPKAKIGPTREI